MNSTKLLAVLGDWRSEKKVYLCQAVNKVATVLLFWRKHVFSDYLTTRRNQKGSLLSVVRMEVSNLHTTSVRGTFVENRLGYTVKAEGEATWRDSNVTISNDNDNSSAATTARATRRRRRTEWSGRATRQRRDEVEDGFAAAFAGVVPAGREARSVVPPPPGCSLGDECKHKEIQGYQRCKNCGNNIHHLCAIDKNWLDPHNEFNVFCSLICHSLSTLWII